MTFAGCAGSVSTEFWCLDDSTLKTIRRVFGEVAWRFEEFGFFLWEWVSGTWRAWGQMSRVRVATAAAVLIVNRCGGQWPRIAMPRHGGRGYGMKWLLFTITDVLFHIIFWMGFSMSVVCFWQFTSIERFIGVLVGHVNSIWPMEGCGGNIAVSALMHDRYRLYIQFDRSRFNQADKAYFGNWQDEKTCFFWETLGATLQVTILDKNRRVVPLVIDSAPYSQFIGGEGQGIGVLDNNRLKLDRITIQYSIAANCEKLLAYHPQIRLYALTHNEVLVARMGLVLLGISLPWVVVTKLRKAYMKKEGRGRGAAGTAN